jgi:GTP-binding protein
VLRSLRALEECDVCIVVVDAQRGLESQDISIISLAQKQGKGIVIMVNKWDLIEKDSKTADTIRKSMTESLAPSNYVPIIFASAIHKQRIFQVVEKAVEVYGNKVKKVPTSQLNDALLPEIIHYPPPSIKGKHIQIKYVTQVNATTPTFAFFCNLPQYIPESYQRFLENKLRDNFDFTGMPVRLFFRKK